MNKESAKKIIDSNNLFTSKSSKNILKIIREEESIDPQSIPCDIDIKSILYLKKLYQQKVNELKLTNGLSEIRPRNLPFYYILQEKYPSFHWKTHQMAYNKAGGHQIILEAPRIENLPLSLFNLLVEEVNYKRDTFLHRRYSIMKNLPDQLVEDLATLISKLTLIYPDHANMNLIIEWLLKGVSGESLTIFSPICPDYSFEKISADFYRYTFNELNSGIGLVAERILTAIPYLREFFMQYQINVKFIIGMADFEALTDSNLHRLNISKTEFLIRIKKSLRAIKEATSSNDTETCMITDLSNGHEGWLTCIKKFKHMFDVNDFGVSLINQNKLMEMAKVRKPLYSQWLGKKQSLQDYLPQLLGQGCEYACMGEIISQQWKNTLILGADHFVMAPFYQVSQTIPTLYLKRIYN